MWHVLEHATPALGQPLCRSACACALLLLLGLGSASLRADENATAALLKQLAADEFDVREKAESQLRALGSGVLPVLKNVIDTTDDAEARIRAKRIAEAIVTGEKLARIYKEYGADPLKLEVAARMMLKDNRPEDARLLFRAASQVCREIATGKTRHAMGPEMARRKADELEIRSMAEAPVRARSGMRIMRVDGARIFVNGLEVGGDVDEQLIEALEIQGGVLQIGE